MVFDMKEYDLIAIGTARANGQPVGEIALLSWLCGAYDVLTAMITTTFLIVP